MKLSRCITIKISLFGDTNQTSPVEAGSQISYDNDYSKSVQQMTGKKQTLKYIEGCSRYDKITYEMLETFLRNGKITKYIEPINKEFNKNICYLNSTRIKVNTDCCDTFVKGKQYEEVNFLYNGKREKYKVCLGMPVMATQNIKDKEIFNTMSFKINDMIEDTFCVEDNWFSKEEFAENFIPSFCLTVYKYQGADINEPYNIHDINRMDKKQLYTALSRTRKFEFIHLDFKSRNNVYKIRSQPRLELVNAKFNSLYKDGKIYEVTFDNGRVYVGSTCDLLEKRLDQHKKDAKSQVYKNKKHKPEIHLIIDAPSRDKKALEAVEKKYIEEYALKYGDKLINKKCNPNKKQDKKERDIQYQIDTEKELRERIKQLEDKIEIKDDGKCFYYDVKIHGKRIYSKTRYNECSKDEALDKIQNKKDEKIKELTLYFE